MSEPRGLVDSASHRLRLSPASAHTVVALVVAFLIPLVHGTAQDFVYDAAQYWGGATALVSGHSPVAAGGLTTRGVYTAIVYSPPAIVASLIGPGAAAWAVLVWNAALGSAVSVILLPRIAGLFASDTLSLPPLVRMWTSALLGGVLLSGFARYPLVDMWAAALALAGFYGLAVGRRWWSLSLAGVLLSVAANLRPATIAPIALSVLILLIVRAKPISISLPGAALAISGQLVFNLAVWHLWSLVPRETGPLSAVQAGPATYTLRYDTVPFSGQDPRQWFCDPAYATMLVDDRIASNQLDVIMSAFRHLPDSLWFLFRKAAANLEWGGATPYGDSTNPASNPLAILVITVSAAGVVALVLHAVKNRSRKRSFVVTLAILGFWFGALGTLVFSTPETRFALPLVLVGLVGILAAIPARVRLALPQSRAVVALLCGIALTVTVLVAGAQAVGDRMPPGPLAGAADCAAQ